MWGPVLVGVGGIAAVIGWIGYASLPSVTGPRPVWWLLPVLAVAFAIAAWVLGPTPGGYAAAAIAGLELAAWAFDRRAGLSKALLPTDVPYWLDRAVTVAAFDGGCRRGRGRDRRPVQVDPARVSCCLDRLDELVLVEGADVAQCDLFVVVDDQGHRQRRGLQRRRQLAVDVEVLVVRDPEIVEVVGRLVTVVADVHADERHLAGHRSVHRFELRSSRLHGAHHVAHRLTTAGPSSSSSRNASPPRRVWTSMSGSRPVGVIRSTAGAKEQSRAT